MNETLITLFGYFKNLRSSQYIVNDIYLMDEITCNFEEKRAIDAIDYCVTKYGDDIRKIGPLFKNKVVVEDDPDLYKRKPVNEILSDTEYIRDCLIVIGSVRSGIRQNFAQVIAEINDD